MTINRLALIGVGLINGSLARALRAAGAVSEVIGCARHVRDLERAVELGVIDHYTTEPAAAVRGADMVVVAVPLGSSEAIFLEIAEHLQADAVLTDAGSVKGSVVRDARAALGARLPRFVPGHPVAGTEHSGVEASFAELFQGHRVVLTPLAETDRDALARVRQMWRATGAEVEEMSVEHHDEVLAATSHLPHVVACALVTCLARLDDSNEIFRFAAGGFRDVTRIASSNPRMWHDILFANREAVVQIMNRYVTEMGRLAAALSDDDRAAVTTLLDRAQAVRADYLARFAPNSAAGSGGSREGNA